MHGVCRLRAADSVLRACDRDGSAQGGHPLACHSQGCVAALDVYEIPEQVCSARTQDDEARRWGPSARPWLQRMLEADDCSNNHNVVPYRQQKHHDPLTDDAGKYWQQAVPVGQPCAAEHHVSPDDGRSDAVHGQARDRDSIPLPYVNACNELQGGRRQWQCGAMSQAC